MNRAHAGSLRVHRRSNDTLSVLRAVKGRLRFATVRAEQPSTGRLAPLALPVAAIPINNIFTGRRKSMEQQGKINKAKEEYRQGENKLMQERRRLNRELNKQSYQKKRRRSEYDPEYAARTHRLVIKGGVFEHFYPETSDMTEPEFYQLIDGLNANAGVRNQILSQITMVHSERGSDG